MKRLGLFMCIVLVTVGEPFRTNAEAAENPAAPSFYLGVNPIATAVPYAGYANMLVQIFSAEEIGLALSAGTYVGESHAVESRLSVGFPNDSTFMLIGSVSWKIFPFGGSDGSGFFFGPDVRVGWLDYHRAGVDYVHLVPSVDAGWVFMFGDIFLNVRAVQSLAAATFSTAPGVAPGVAWLFSPWPTATPVLPVLSVDIGYVFR